MLSLLHSCKAKPLITLNVLCRLGQGPHNPQTGSGLTGEHNRLRLVCFLIDSILQIFHRLTIYHSKYFLADGTKQPATSS